MTDAKPNQIDEALIIVDAQPDFCPRGALAVAEGDEVIAPINQLARTFPFVIATRDWHPPDHRSFNTEGGPWPVHCVRDTPGAELHPPLDREQVIDNGQAPALEGYPAFEATPLEALLRSRGIERLHLTGLALDARRLGFSAVVHRSATRAADVHAGDGDRAIAELRAGASRSLPDGSREPRHRLRWVPEVRAGSVDSYRWPSHARVGACRCAEGSLAPGDAEALSSPSIRPVGRPMR
jgi:nicotinamidase/pyrazinamidase